MYRGKTFKLTPWAKLRLGRGQSGDVPKASVNPGIRLADQRGVPVSWTLRVNLVARAWRCKNVSSPTQMI